MGLNTKCRCPTQYPVASLENHTPISAIRLMLCIFNGTTHFPKLTHTHAHPSTRTHRIHTTCQMAALPTCHYFTVESCIARSAAASAEPLAAGNSTARGCCARQGSRPPPRGDSCWSASHLITFWRSPGQIRLSVCSICSVRYYRCKSRMRIARCSNATRNNINKQVEQGEQREQEERQ